MQYTYKAERNAAFLERCEKIRAENHHTLSVSEIACKAIHTEADSFYISRKQCSRIINPHFYKNRIRTKLKSEMYGEIRNRADGIKKYSPHLNYEQISRIIVEQKAPRFYMSEYRAVQLYYELLRTHLCTTHFY